ncbi:hypothetical protein [Microcella alkaliphila]|uniref:Nuclear transport factor 2 family protein n=1 Tax=Microcella alkaliphila TaxID=279828 RepID=A0A0U4NUM4_9MICO|nr:hypothetical protein [Microcella alkaliphila]BAU32035.1 uncharacterized protein MalAC0309_1177 [Microcella alkaliphila]
MPRRPRTAAAGLLIFALVATLAGCSDTTRIPDPTPEATADPLFASDEEALAAAVEVYERYLAATDEAFESGGSVDDLTEVAEGEALEDLALDFEELEEGGLATSGYRTVTATQFQSRFRSEDPEGEVVIFYACEDVSDTDLVDQSGNSLVTPDRNPLTPFEIEVQFRDDSRQLVTSRDFWAEGGICETP